MVTIKDVAKDAGVSISTVSRVVNNLETVAPELRVKVNASIEKLRYLPNQSARSLVKNKSHLLGIIFEDMSNPFHYEFLKTMFIEIEKENYNVIVCDNNFDEDRCIKNIDDLISRGVDGIKYISMKRYSDRMIDKIQDVYHSGTAMLIPHNVGIDNIPTIVFDDYNATYEALDYLTDLGHKKIALVTVEYDTVNQSRRVATYVEYMKEHNIFDESMLIMVPKNVDRVAFLAEKIKEVKCTAVFAQEDMLAVDVYHAVTDIGLTIPNDISIVGFGDIDLSKHLNPPLSTIHLNIEEFARLSATKLLDMIHSGFDPEMKCESIELLSTFMKRKSCTSMKEWFKTVA